MDGHGFEERGKPGSMLLLREAKWIPAFAGMTRAGGFLRFPVGAASAATGGIRRTRKPM
jgi:hypothetical protein